METPRENTEDYLRLLAQNERDVTAYVYSLVNRREDAEDILQEAKVVMWRKFDDFELGTNFKAWAKKIALGLILNHRRKEKTRATSPVEHDFLEAVAAEIDRRGDELEKRGEALRSCVRKLPKAHQQMIAWRYYEENEIPEIAKRTNKTDGATYRLLSRIRKALAECVETTLNQKAFS